MREHSLKTLISMAALPVALLAAAGCGDAGNTPSPGTQTGVGEVGTGGAASAGGGNADSGAGNLEPTTGGADEQGNDPGSSTGGNSLGDNCTSFMGKTELLVGGTLSEESSDKAPFDMHYRYLAGEVRKEGVCQEACSDDCKSWWGCWQSWSEPPGKYVKNHITDSQNASWSGGAYPQIPAITYYIWYQTMKPSEWCAPATNCEGAKEVAALNDAALLKRFLDDWRFLLQTVGQAEVLLHVEPDLWGYIKQVNSDPTQVPVKVKQGNALDCSGFGDNAAGLGKCMIAMTRKYAPNATVGLHASPWTYTSPNDGTNTGEFMLALGGGEGDFIATDPSDRDAGYYETVRGQNRWWTDDSAAAYLAWSKELSDTMSLPSVMWQIPFGNMSLDNTENRYKDNRVDYLFAHLEEVAQARVAALLFGAGNTWQTNIDTDGGNFVNKSIASHAAGRPALCW